MLNLPQRVGLDTLDSTKCITNSDGDNLCYDNILWKSVRNIMSNFSRSHLQAGWAWMHLRVHGRARQSGASTTTWAGLSVGTEVDWSFSPVGWDLSLGAAGVLRGSGDWGGASQDSQSPRRAAMVFWCVFRLCQNPGPSLWLPLGQPPPQQGSCREQLKDQLTIWQLSTCGEKMYIVFTHMLNKDCFSPQQNH